MEKGFLNKKDSLALEEFRLRVLRLLGKDLEKIALFGSKAEGRDTAESDIDVFILIKDSKRVMRRQIFDEAFEVNLKYGVYISPRVITLHTYQHPIWRMTPFLKRLRDKAIPL